MEFSSQSLDLPGDLCRQDLLLATFADSSVRLVCMGRALRTSVDTQAYKNDVAAAPPAAAAAVEMPFV